VSIASNSASTPHAAAAPSACIRPAADCPGATPGSHNEWFCEGSSTTQAAENYRVVLEREEGEFGTRLAVLTVRPDWQSVAQRPLKNKIPYLNSELPHILTNEKHVSFIRAADYGKAEIPGSRVRAENLKFEHLYPCG
jgi:hypothetical protein